MALLNVSSTSDFVVQSSLQNDPTINVGLEKPSATTVLIIATGGTFVMKPSAKGLVPTRGLLSEKMSKDSDFHHHSLPKYEIIEWDPLLDSSSFTQQHWIILANQIFEKYNNYNGFIILHGTDTMAYTASALSFMLENLGKPVVLTGAQIPIGEVFNDAKNNLIASLVVAGKCQICEVCIMFNNKLFRGNRTTKIDPWHQDAFESPNFPPLGLFGVDLEIEEKLFLNAPTKRFFVSTGLFINILVIWLIPGFSDRMLESILSDTNKALILRFYGIGNAPQKQEFYELLYQIKKKDIEIVIMSQCEKGHIDTKLSIGNFFDKLNLINASDMTVEATVTKLAYLMGKGYKGSLLKHEFEKNIRGEQTSAQDINNRIIKFKHEIIKIVKN